MHMTDALISPVAWSASEKNRFLPDYSFKKVEEKQGVVKSHEGDEAAKSEEGKEEGWPNVSAGRSFSGIILKFNRTI
jgi:hypothetical protein